MPTIESHVAEVARTHGITTISGLAKAACLDRGTVRRVWERPMPQYMKMSTVTRLCKALNAQVSDLFEYKPQDDAPLPFDDTPQEG